MTTEERFWSMVERREPTECWIWTGPRKRSYGGFWYSSGQLAHRYSFELARGPIPDGMTIDHVCFTPLCVNPDHLRILSHAENAARQRSKLATHCARGHAYTPENERRVRNRMPNGNWSNSRRCRICSRAAEKARKELLAAKR